MPGNRQGTCHKRAGIDMIVGTKNLDMYDIRNYCHTVSALRDYSDSLVPRILRHNQQIVNNQRYLVALVVRNIKSIPWSRRKELYEGLLEGVAISGLANQVYDYEDIMYEIDVDRISDYINRGGLRNV